MSDLKIFAKTIDAKAKTQIDTLLAQPAFADCKVRIMPDVHAGIGCVIGFTADLGDKVIPNIVGVDIGCGMLTVGLGNIDIDFDKLDCVIRENVPSGMNVNETPNSPFVLQELKCYGNLKNIDWIERSLGSLGGGNHFIEVDTDDKGNKYLVIHTGSRNLGKQVAEYYQAMAIATLNGKGKLNTAIAKYIKDCKASGQESEIEQGIAKLKQMFKPIAEIPNELCYLEGEWRDRYLWDMGYCQFFAHMNRGEIANRIMRGMRWEIQEAFETIHNYIDRESNIVRKGAISAKKGERVLIPINMRDGCIIGEGKGNKDWNFSAPHGAGRIMSRMQAKETLRLEDYRETMNGIYTTSVCDETIDEAPQAYKPMQEIVDCIQDTVKIEKFIKPIYNFKTKE